MSHQPRDYDCPFCRVAQDRFDESVWTAPDDLVFRASDLCAFVSAGQFSADPDYPGHVLVIPVMHYENLYGIPDDVLGRVSALRRRISRAFKALGAEGTSSRQHNEPAGNQDVWHYHEHVLPRYADDDLYAQPRRRVDDVHRAAQAARIRGALTDVLAELPLMPPTPS